MSEILDSLVKYVHDLEAQVVADGDLISSLNGQNVALTNQVASLQATVKDLKRQLRPEWEVKVDEVLDTAFFLYQKHLDSGKTLFPYLFGGNPKLNEAKEVIGGTFDCSSYAKYCFGLHGYVLPRASKDQALVGLSVSKEDIRKGDLIFFDTNADKIINHVGIALGDGTFIHANPSGGGLNIMPLTGSWDKWVVSVKRIIE